VPVRFTSSSGRDLNTRFAVDDQIQTRCILSADDDIDISAAALEFGFQAWRMSRVPIVGYVPRRHRLNPQGDWAYDLSRPLQDLPYSMILVSRGRTCSFHPTYCARPLFPTGQTDMAFVDVALLDVYNDPMLHDQRNFVREIINCEDILLNFVGTIGEPSESFFSMS
jgi:hypothetical protein